MASSFEHIVTCSLQCPCCSQPISDPQQFSCTHTFCKKCFSNIIASSSQTTANALACPICRSTKDVRGGQQLCEMCDTNTQATHFCCECGKNMCKTCLENHNKWPSNNKHRVESVADIREGKVVLKKKVYCQEHKPDEEEHVCTDVCITCKKFICMRCRLIKHKGHTVQSAEEYKASIKTEIESLLARGKTKRTTIKNHQTCIESQKKRVTDHIDDRKAEINKICQESIKKINERRAVLDKQLETQRVKLCQRLDEMKDADEKLVTSIESASVSAGNSLKAPLDGDTIVIRDSVSGEFKNVLGRGDPMKKLATDVADRAEQLIFTPNNQHDQLHIGEVQFITYKLKCDVAFSKKDELNCMVPTPDGMMAVGYSEQGIYFFSAGGKLQQTVLKGVNNRAIGFLSDGRHVVRHDWNTITLYTQEWEKLDVSFETLSKDEGGYGGLTVDSNDLIYVSYVTAKKIQVFSPAGGKATREIPCDGYQPDQIAIYDDLLIINTGSTIRMIDIKGNVKHTVKKSGVDAYAAVTQNNSILIAWVNRNYGLVSIDAYTNELKYIKTLISDEKIEKPERWWCYLQEFRAGDIAFCTPDRLYIFKLFTTPIHV